MVFTHELGQSAIELTNIIGKQLTVAEDLKQQLLLILFADKPTLDPNSLISHLLPTIIEDLLGPDAPLLLFLESLDLQVALIKVKLANLAMVEGLYGPTSLEEGLILGGKQTGGVLVVRVDIAVIH